MWRVNLDETPHCLTLIVAVHPVFDEVVRLVFGECGPDETRRLHAATRGAIGPLLHIAGLRGLKPPYAVPREQVLRLPAPA